MLQARIFVAEHEKDEQYRGKADCDRQTGPQQDAVNDGQWPHVNFFPEWTIYCRGEQTVLPITPLIGARQPTSLA